jgi:tetratricopeptide (TPR) repeat protein
MRLAIIAASRYTQNSELADLAHVGQELDWFSQRLAEHDAGFRVHVFDAERGLVEAVEQLLAGISEPIEALLFYFAGYAVVSEERGAALLLDGERLRTLSLKRLARLFNQRSPSTLAVLDTVSAFDGMRSPVETVRLLDTALAGERSRIHLLAANRAERDGTLGPSPFTSLLAMVLDWQSGSRGLSAASLYGAMRAEEGLFANIPAAEFYPADTPFHLLVPNAAPLVSVPPASAPLGAADEAEAYADALVKSSDFEAALAQYTIALEHLGPPTAERHPRLYLKIAEALRGAGTADKALAYYDAAIELDANCAAALLGAGELRSAAGDTATALTLLNRCLRVDPNALNAADLAAKLLTEAQRWNELVLLYELVLPRVSDPTAATELALTLTALCRDFVADPGRALGPLEHAATLAPGDFRLRLPLVLLYRERGQFERALHHLVAALRADPGYVRGYRMALVLSENCGRRDAAWNAACALELLGAANINESLLAHTHLPDGLLPARGTLTETDWIEKRLCPERDARIDALFQVLGDATVEVALETAQRKRRLVSLDPGLQQDPEKSTATIAKTLLWSAKLLGVGLPKLYVMPDLPAAFAAPPAREATLLASRTLGSGLELRELAFLWGRQLALLRPEHRVLSLFPTDEELMDLLRAALSLGGIRQLAFRKLEGDAKLFARGLKRHLSADAQSRLSEVARGFPLEEAGPIMRSWLRAVELSAGRAGLVCTGNLDLCSKLIERFPLEARVPRPEQVRDLMAYSVSDEYALLRARIGVLVQN